MKTLEEHVAAVMARPAWQHGWAALQDAVKAAARAALEQEDAEWRERHGKHTRSQATLSGANPNHKVVAFAEPRPDAQLAAEVARIVLERIKTS